MEADRAHSPTAGAAGLPPHGATPAEFRPGPAGPDPGWVAGGLDLLERADGPWIPIDPPSGRPEVDPGPVDRRDRGRERRRAARRLTAAYLAVLALLVGGLVVAVAANHRLHGTDDQLATVRVRLEHTISRARVAEHRLDTVTAESAAAGTTLGAETARLAAAQARLASTETDVFANGVSIGQLDTCLAGVERALNQISLNDQQGAAASLDGVATACRAAEPSP